MGVDLTQFGPADPGKCLAGRSANDNIKGVRNGPQSEVLPEFFGGRQNVPWLGVLFRAVMEVPPVGSCRVRVILDSRHDSESRSLKAE